jgi:hypothetical protein
VVEGLRVPTLAEMARIKAWLLVVRHTVRDSLDTVVLLERLGEDGGRSALGTLDAVYRQPNGASPLVELVERLAAAAPPRGCEGRVPCPSRWRTRPLGSGPRPRR